MQLSYGTKYAKQYCDEAMVALMQENKCKRKEINKNTIIFSLVPPEQNEENRELVLNLMKMETEEQQFDAEIAQLEKDIKEIKL